MRVLLIDGKNVCFRSGWVHKTLHASDGTLTGCLHGFLSTMLRLKKQYPESKFVVAWDSPHDKKSWRWQLFPAYKDRGTGPVPDFVKDIQCQIPLVQEALECMGVPQVKFDGVEADDIISVVARACLERDWRPTVYSSDLDYVQLIPLGVDLIRDSEKGGLPELETVRSIESRYGVPLAKVPHLRAVVGDKSDGIPGAIPGVGPVRAKMLISAGLDPSKKTLAEQPRQVQGYVGAYWEDIRRNYRLMRMLARADDAYRLGDGAEAFGQMVQKVISRLYAAPTRASYPALVEMLGRLEMASLMASRRELCQLQVVFK